MNDYLTDLLNRLSDDSYREGEAEIPGVYESAKTVSWSAYEEVRGLRDPALLPLLYPMPEQTNDTSRRHHLYFIIGHLAKNCHVPEAAVFLAARLQKERDTLVLITILDRLADIYKPASFDLSPIQQVIEKKGFLIRSAAYRALLNTGHRMEDYFLEKIQQEQRRDDLVELLGAIKYIGTGRTLAALEPLLKNRKQKVKWQAKETMAVIMLREGFPITEVCRKLKIPALNAQSAQKNLPLFTKPG